MIPGWPYSVIAALEPGRTSWTAVLDTVRPGPDDDDVAVTAAQIRDVATPLLGVGHWRKGDPHILVIFDAGYDVTRLAYLLADPVPGQTLRGGLTWGLRSALVLIRLVYVFGGLMLLARTDDAKDAETLALRHEGRGVAAAGHPPDIGLG